MTACMWVVAQCSTVKALPSQWFIISSSCQAAVELGRWRLSSWGSCLLHGFSLSSASLFSVDVQRTRWPVGQGQAPKELLTMVIMILVHVRAVLNWVDQQIFHPSLGPDGRCSITLFHHSAPSLCSITLCFPPLQAVVQTPLSRTNLATWTLRFQQPSINQQSIDW